MPRIPLPHPLTSYRYCPQPLHAGFPPRGIVQGEGRGVQGVLVGDTLGDRVSSNKAREGSGLKLTTIKMSLSDCEWECTSNTSGTSARGEEAFARKKAGVQKGELNSQLIEYINEWRKTREKDEEELRKLKEKQARRKEIRAEQERVINKHKKEDEDRMRREEAERREHEVREKKKQLEEAEVKRQAMLELQKTKAREGRGEKAGAAVGAMSEARREMSKTKEQLEEEKNLALSIRIKTIDFDVLDSYELGQKAKELYNVVVALETDKYDMEQRALNQEYELTELKERQRLQLRQRAVKKGLHPEALSGRHPPKVRMMMVVMMMMMMTRHPPKVRMYSKYERRMDTRTYEDRKTLYEGGWEVIRGSLLEQMWTDKYDEWGRRHVRRLPR